MTANKVRLRCEFSHGSDGFVGWRGVAGVDRGRGAGLGDAGFDLALLRAGRLVVVFVVVLPDPLRAAMADHFLREPGGAYPDRVRPDTPRPMDHDLYREVYRFTSQIDDREKVAAERHKELLTALDKGFKLMSEALAKGLREIAQALRSR